MHNRLVIHKSINQFKVVVGLNVIPFVFSTTLLLYKFRNQPSYHHSRIYFWNQNWWNYPFFGKHCSFFPLKPIFNLKRFNFISMNLHVLQNPPDKAK